MSNVSSEIVVDALPYIDLGYDDPGVREAALSMVDEECRRYRPTKNYLEHMQPLILNAFETDIMRIEFERMQNRLPMVSLSMKRYELPPPPSGKLSDYQAWSECVDNSCAQLEHQATRVLNLELMLEYGCETWKAHLEILSNMLSVAQAEHQAIRKEIQEVNWQRKSLQTMGGEKLRALESQWVALVSKNYEIEQACAEIEQKISMHKNLHKERTKNEDNSGKVQEKEHHKINTSQEEKSTSEDDKTNEQMPMENISDNVNKEIAVENKQEQTDIFED